jgi:hypothetical protein
MNANDLPRLGRIENVTDADFLPHFGIDLTGKDVLAIGYNEKQLNQ